jgi:hypothetical protein
MLALAGRTHRATAQFLASSCLSCPPDTQIGAEGGGGCAGTSGQQGGSMVSSSVSIRIAVTNVEVAWVSPKTLQVVSGRMSLGPSENNCDVKSLIQVMASRNIDASGGLDPIRQRKLLRR